MAVVPVCGGGAAQTSQPAPAVVSGRREIVRDCSSFVDFNDAHPASSVVSMCSDGYS